MPISSKLAKFACCGYGYVQSVLKSAGTVKVEARL